MKVRLYFFFTNSRVEKKETGIPYEVDFVESHSVEDDVKRDSWDCDFALVAIALCKILSPANESSK